MPRLPSRPSLPALLACRPRLCAPLTTRLPAPPASPASLQCTPHLGQAAKELIVFQRTPSSIDIRNQRDTSPEFASEFLSAPGWQKERIRNFYQAWLSLSPR